MLSEEFILTKIKTEAIVCFNMSINAETGHESCCYMLEGANIIRFAKTLGIVDADTAEAWISEYAKKSGTMFLERKLERMGK